MPTNLSHTGLEVIPGPNPLTQLLVNILEIELGMPGDISTLGLRQGTPVRYTNLNGGAAPEPGYLVDVSKNGSFGLLDAGPIKPNTDYYLWVRGDGYTPGAAGFDMGVSSVFWGAWPPMPAGWTYARACMWLRTDANGNLIPQIKQDYEYQFLPGYEPVAFRGMTAPSTWQALAAGPGGKLNGLVSVTGGGYITLQLSYGTPGKEVLLSENGGGSACFWRFGPGSSVVERVRLNGYADGLAVMSTDPGLVVSVSGGTDTQ